jgi:UDP-glucose 4-epimerase
VRILVTGHRGKIGRVVTSLLQDEGHDVTGFDRLDGNDVLDRPALRLATERCDAVIHLAADDVTADDAPTPGTRWNPEDIIMTNGLGTANVLDAAARANVLRVIFLSSVDALGIFLGEKAPDYLPIDDDHPTYPSSPYDLSKRLAEEMCRSFTAETGIPTICLRPPGVFDEATYTRIKAARVDNPEFEWSPFWEYGAFIDVRDVASAISAGLTCSDPGHVRLLLCADDISSAHLASRAMARKLHPDVPWHGGPELDDEPYRALLDTRRARQILGWAPAYRWRPSGPTSRG